MSASERLKALGITLPSPAAAIAAYVPFVRSGNLLFVSGQLPLAEGKVSQTGLHGAGVTIEQGKEAARLSAINLLAQVQAAAGSLDKVKRVVRLGGFIAATPDFADHPKVMNGASELMEAVFGEAGRHARTTIGVSSLPLAAAVEVEGLFELAD